MIIKVRNLQTIEAPKTYLASSVATSGTSLYVKNIANFVDDWYLQLGETGEERSEIKVVNGTPSGTTITSGAVSFDHPTDTPLYCIKYDQVIFKRSTVGTAGTVSNLTDGTVNITPDWDYTQFDDTSGSVSYAYKVSYYNSTSTVESSDSDWITPAGYDFYSLAKIRERTKAKMVNKADDSDIDDWTNEWLERMTNAVIDVNQDYAMGTANLAYSGTADEATITSTDFKQIRRAWYTENGTDVVQMTKMEFADASPNTTYSSTHPYFSMKGDNVVVRYPSDNSGTISLDYYKLNSILVNDTDNLPTPMRGYTNSFIKWNLAQAARLDNRPGDADTLEGQAEADLMRFKKEMTPRHKTGPEYISIVEGWDEGGW